MKQLQQLLHHFKCMEKTVPKTSKKIWEIIEFQKLIKIEFLLPGGCKELEKSWLELCLDLCF